MQTKLRDLRLLECAVISPLDVLYSSSQSFDVRAGSLRILLHVLEVCLQSSMWCLSAYLLQLNFILSFAHNFHFRGMERICAIAGQISLKRWGLPFCYTASFSSSIRLSLVHNWICMLYFQVCRSCIREGSRCTGIPGQKNMPFSDFETVKSCFLLNTWKDLSPAPVLILFFFGLYAMVTCPVHCMEN